MKRKYNYITEVLNKAQLNQMLDHKGGFTLIVSPTGTGKSTFIIEDIIKPHFENKRYGFGKGIYQDFANKKILVMANRTAVVLKFNADVEKACEEMGIYRTKGLTVASYQKVSHGDMLFEIDEAEIILCDEAHYFVADSWNGTTSKLMKKVLRASEQKPVIFFTATPQQITKYFNHIGILNYKEFDFRDVLGFQDRMDFICTNKDLDKIINEIGKDEKIMIFVPEMTSKALMARMAEKYRKKGYKADFLHSVWKKTKDGRFNGLKVPSMDAKVKQLVNNKKFDYQIAIANTAIDNGIDIIDPDFKHIILMNQYDHVQIQQMVGRKRFDVHYPNDRLKVWLTTENKPELKNFFDRVVASIRFIEKFEKYRTENMEDAIKSMRYYPGNKDKSDTEIFELAEQATLDSFFKDEVIQKEAENLGIEKEHVISEEYPKLQSYKLDYITPLINKHLMDSEEALSTDELQNIVKNYVKLVKELFERPASIQWRNKYIASEENKIEYKQRVTEELTPYLGNRIGIRLFDEEKDLFQEKMSHYFGASKRVVTVK